MSVQPPSLSRTKRAVCLTAALMALHGISAWAQTAPPLLGEGTHAVMPADVLAETMTLDTAARANMLSAPDAVQRMATDIYVRRQMSERAVAQKIDQQPDVQRLLQIVRERVLSDAFARHQEAQARPTGPVLEKLALQNYQAHPQRFQQPERVHARHILIPGSATDARAQAEALRQLLLQQRASFEEMARQHSKDPGTAHKGGDLGFITRGKMVAPFEEAAFALEKPGQLSPVVETRFGFHVIELVEKRPAGLQPFDEVKAQLVQEAAGGIAMATRQEVVRPFLDAAKPHPEAIEAFSASQRQ